MSQHPAPQLPTGTWQAIISGENGSRNEIRSKLHVIVVNGRTKSVEITQTTGFNFVDSELVNWIQTQWHFRPEVTGDFDIPIALRLPPIMTIVTDSYRSADPLVLHVWVDHGVIKKMDLVHSSGERLLDNSAGVWVKQQHLFSEDQSGEVNLTVFFKFRRPMPNAR
jgi:outer membrane biosynthesis protein TonB